MNIKEIDYKFLGAIMSIPILLAASKKIVSSMYFPPSANLLIIVLAMVVIRANIFISHKYKH